MKRALIIGINEYDHFGNLDNCINDANDLNDFLIQQQFDCELVLNEVLSNLVMKIHEFKMTLNPDDISLIYFSGHGLQDDKHNYLVAKDSEIRKTVDIKYNCLHAEELYVEDIKGGLHIIILDACRNNPFKDERKGIQFGLNSMIAPQGTIVAFSTSPNSPSIERSNERNGIYTKCLLQSMSQPNTPIELMFKYTRNKVMRESGNGQVPWEESSLSGGDFSFIEIPMNNFSKQIAITLEAFVTDLKQLNLTTILTLIDSINLNAGDINSHQYYLTLAMICWDFENNKIQARTFDSDYLNDKTYDKYYPDFLEHLSRTPEIGDNFTLDLLDDIELISGFNVGYNFLSEDPEDAFPQFFINDIIYKEQEAVFSCFLYISESNSAYVLRTLIIFKSNPLQFLNFKNIEGDLVSGFLAKYFEMRKPFEKKIEDLIFPNFKIVEDDESGFFGEI